MPFLRCTAGETGLERGAEANSCSASDLGEVVCDKAALRDVARNLIVGCLPPALSVRSTHLQRPLCGERKCETL